MTSLAYGLDMPYEVQLEHTSDPSNNHMIIRASQRSPDFPVTRHRLNPGVYMVSLSYNGAAGATLHHVGAGPDNKAQVPAGTAGVPRTSAPMKISVQDSTEYLYVVAPGTGGSARATISVIPTSTFDEMAESAQGVSVLSDISNLKSTLDARVPADTSLRLDTSVGTRVFAGNIMIYGDTGWRAMAAWGSDGSLVGELPDGMFAQEGVDGGIYYRRVNGLVTLRILAARAESGNLQIRIPSGFDPGGAPWPVVTLSLSSSTLIAHVKVGATYAYVSLRGASASEPVDLPSSGPSYASEATWGTKRNWPTTLPGLPA